MRQILMNTLETPSEQAERLLWKRFYCESSIKAQPTRHSRL